jgi:dTDP-4-dehydrorhamnose reductase
LNNHKQTILVTGANGQLGNELRTIAADHAGYHFIFAIKEELPVENPDIVKKYFNRHPINYCINCAAYTAVDKAETEKEEAFLINGIAVGDLAAICHQHNTQLIHISTDYVFDGTAEQPYKETDSPCPVNSYGASKLKGEQLAIQNDPSTIIIRTSWLYAAFGNNFVRTMLRLMKEKESINVVNDQYGSPTYAADLAEAIMVIIEGHARDCDQPAIFNYCNSGIISWYEFALAIKDITGSKCIINPIPTSQYPTAAKRPLYTVLDTTKIHEAFHILIPGWKESLEKCLFKLQASGQ